MKAVTHVDPNCMHRVVSSDHSERLAQLSLVSRVALHMRNERLNSALDQPTQLTSAREEGERRGERVFTSACERKAQFRACGWHTHVTLNVEKDGASAVPWCTCMRIWCLHTWATRNAWSVLRTCTRSGSPEPLHLQPTRP